MGRARKNSAPCCKKCGDTNPANFRDQRISRCKRCHGAYVLARYREKQIALGKTPKLRPRKPKDFYDPAIVSIAARFGLSVEQYRQVKSEAQS